MNNPKSRGGNLATLLVINTRNKPCHKKNREKTLLNIKRHAIMEAQKKGCVVAIYDAEFQGDAEGVRVCCLTKLTPNH